MKKAPTTKTKAGRKSKRPKTRLEKLADSRAFTSAYAVFSALVLLATTIFWATLGAKVQLANADQLSSTNLMGHVHSLSSAILPGQHTFLLKWPIFLLVGALGDTKAAITAITVAIAVVTVAALAFTLYRIERRPLIFGTLCLALASVLLLVPAQPYPGGILPVNMAMLTTRNLEYACYILALFLLLRSKKLRSISFILSVLVLSTLIASDKLFLALSAGGAALSLVIYAVVRRWTLVGLAVRWLVGSIVAGVLASALLVLLNDHHIVHIVNSATVSPYGSIDNLHSLELAVIYAFIGLFTIFGANPATDPRVLREMPSQIFHSLISIEGLALIVNIILLGYGVFIVYRLVVRTIVHGKQDPVNKGHSLALMLVWSTVIAFGAFIGSKHYYPVDARYVQIALFAVFIAGASYSRTLKLKPQHIAIAAAILLLSILSGLWGATHVYHTDQRAMAIDNSRDALIAQAMKQHAGSVLVGDYWRVLPTQLLSENKVQVMPMAGCTQPLTVLTSSKWQYNLQTHQFAYLLTLDKSLTGYPSCSLKQITSVYGQPNTTAVISGTILNPKEVLLFYDQGIHKVVPPVKHKVTTTVTAAVAPSIAAVIPESLESLPDTTCPGPTDMNIVAHEDDDLLFMNPDVLHSIQAGYCIRTLYITAGNSGLGEYYWVDRQQGAESAYSEMTGASTVWDQQYVKLTNNEVITVANPEGDPKVSLIFFNLPDGNVNGSGFPSSHFESLAKLYDGHIPTITSVDGSSVYTSDSLVSAIETLMHAYQPTIIRTQQTNDSVGKVVDHSDHMAVGKFVEGAYTKYESDALDNQVTIPLELYMGYPIRIMPANVTGTDLNEKITAFFTYAIHDPNVCKSMAQCEQQNSNYNLYIMGQYSYTH